MKTWIMENKAHTAAIVVCAVLAIAVHPVVAGIVGALYIAYANGKLDGVVAAVKSKLGA